MHAVEKEEDTD
ncbi:Putative uncharacterized protein [Escherichia coli D6-117.29]|nr:Protein of unknown function [Escherichia coli]CDP76674.1 Putative uncharacterized protein [Escherichia coli D6-117.29]CDU40218.1 Protein of unknown function [Escherichia coli]